MGDPILNKLEMLEILKEMIKKITCYNSHESSDFYPLESYVTHVSHGSLQGAPEKITLKKLSLKTKKLEY